MFRPSLFPRPAPLLVAIGACVGLLSAAATAQHTARVSVDSASAEADADSESSALSEDGRFVAFHSAATNLVTGDTNSRWDVFVRDRRQGTTTRVSVSSAGLEGDQDSRGPVISADGQVVAFWSGAGNLVTGDDNGALDVFVHDRSTGVTSRVSVDSKGKQGNGNSWSIALSADGGLVAFQSNASNLVGNDTNATTDVFVHDRASGATRRVSVTSAGVQGNGVSAGPSMSADGRFVGFSSWADNLVGGDNNLSFDVFLRDRLLATTTLISVNLSGQVGDDDCYDPSLSADGRFVAFDGWATDLVAADTNGTSDVFVRDRQTGTTRRVSVDSTGVEGNNYSVFPSLSADGQRVAFRSDASNLVAGDTNGAIDIFLHDRTAGTTTRVSVDSSGVEGNQSSSGPRLSADGRFVEYESRATNLVPGDTNGSTDVFLHGPHLTLEATPVLAPPGTSLSLTTWGGLPAGLVLLFAVDFNGGPVFFRVGKGLFDGAGSWTLSATVPPGLTGNVVGFASFGIEPTLKAGISNQESVTF